MTSRIASTAVATVLLLALLPGAAMADSYTPSHFCVRPFKPHQFNSRGEVEDFMLEVEEYRRCIEEFVDEQNRAAKRHMNAADQAIEDWNSFVVLELN